MSRISWPKSRFLPTPSARRATLEAGLERTLKAISTHALREEGDADVAKGATMRAIISTHALREEGDASQGMSSFPDRDFYPRPPRGGRQGSRPPGSLSPTFLPTPSARRATHSSTAPTSIVCGFLPTPSARRATL